MRYVVGCTEDERGREAIALARALARAPGAELDLVHVLPGPGDQLRLAQEREYQQYLAGQADAWLDKALALVPADVTARKHAEAAVRYAPGRIPTLMLLADLARRAADQQQRAVAGQLQAAGRDHLHEVADVQGGGGRVEADIERDRAAVEVPAQLLGVGGVLDQSAPLHVVNESHREIVSHRAWPDTPGLGMPVSRGGARLGR